MPKKLLIIILFIIVSNIVDINSIKDRTPWFRPNQPELNSPETMDYSSNSLNERIINNLDTIEKGISVDIEYNEKTHSNDSKSGYLFNSNNILNEIHYRNSLNRDNSLKHNYEYKKDNISYDIEFNDRNSTKLEVNSGEYNVNNKTIPLKDILIDINNDYLNQSLINSENIEIQNLFSPNSKTIPAFEHSISDSLMETTTTSSDSDIEYQMTTNMFPLDSDLKNSNSIAINTNLIHNNKYNNNNNNNVIITAETLNVGVIETTTTARTRSNSIIDRLNKIRAEETANRNLLTKKYYKNSATPIEKSNNSCNDFVQSIGNNQYICDNNLIIKFEQKPESYLKSLCLYLSARNDCNYINESDISQCNNSIDATGIKCTNVNISECKLKLENRDGKLNFIIGWYGCKDSYTTIDNNKHCINYSIKFDISKTERDNRVIVIITATVVPIIVCVAILSICFYIKKKNRNSMKKFDCFGVKILKQMPYKSKSRKRRVDKMPNDANTPGSAVINMEEVRAHSKVTLKSKPISMSNFNQYYQLNRADSGLKLAEEYEELKELTAKKRTTKISQLTINRPKNRFVNILPYDHSIVALKLKNGVIGSDYINANFIAGFNCDNEYIACQGPLNSTVNDFYRMIIEHNIRIVVMLTQCIEKGRQKCEKYWPNVDDIDETCSQASVPNMTFDDITVELCDEKIEDEFIIRDLKLIKDDSHHFLTQYHFIQWPDFGCPQNPYSLIHLIEVIRKQFQIIINSNNSEDKDSIKSPILVHCSAGVGRSGTFIAVDRTMQMLTKTVQNSDQSVAKDFPIDIFGTVLDMRRYRPNMVQTEDQYIYIYDCIKYLIDRTENKSLKTNLEETNCDNQLKEKSISSIETSDRHNEQMSVPIDSNSNKLKIMEKVVDFVDEVQSGAHINRQFSLDESSENTEL